ncbi:MAG: diacylglycerol kinase [Armatimonadetes bacterium]|nr:diacylglycerol kinase [Candidatus Hippobium faecium]
MNKLKESTGNFKYAIEGLVHVYRSQKHMRFHLLALIVAGLFSVLLKLTSIEILLVVAAVSFVVITEMINTAIEAVVDLVTQRYHPLAKFAKDIGAGATLVAAVNAVIVGIFIVFGRHENETKMLLQGDKFNQPVILIVIAFIIMIAIIIMYKVAGNKGKIWKGGVISVHSAVGFFLAWTAFYLSKEASVCIICLSMAALIAQSRVEGGIHTLQEVIWGAIVATVISFFIYVILVPIW